MRDNALNKQCKKDFIFPKTLEEKIPNHKYDFIINRLLSEVRESINLKELNDSWFDEWKDEINKNLINEL